MKRKMIWGLLAALSLTTVSYAAATATPTPAVVYAPARPGALPARIAGNADSDKTGQWASGPATTT